MNKRKLTPPHETEPLSLYRPIKSETILFPYLRYRSDSSDFIMMKLNPTIYICLQKIGPLATVFQPNSEWGGQMSCDRSDFERIPLAFTDSRFCDLPYIWYIHTPPKDMDMHLRNPVVCTPPIRNVTLSASLWCSDDSKCWKVKQYQVTVTVNLKGPTCDIYMIVHQVFYLTCDVELNICWHLHVHSKFSLTLDILPSHVSMISIT